MLRGDRVPADVDGETEEDGATGRVVGDTELLGVEAFVKHPLPSIMS